MNEISALSATKAINLIKSGDLCPIDLVDACISRIEAVDPLINALPIRCFEQARERAASFNIQTDKDRGWLCGLPVAIKDLHDVKNVKTSFASPIFSNNTAATSSPHVEMLLDHGAIVIGKSNSSEFGAGAQTYNNVFGTTLNPWDQRKTVAGSSGGSAAALAACMVPLADGSDMGGSLRTPAAFCSVVGLRPSPSRVPFQNKSDVFQNLSVAGPMARNCADLALFLDAMCGQHERDPLSFERSANAYTDTIKNPATGGMIGYSADLGGITPVSDTIERVCTKSVGKIASNGFTIDTEGLPDFSQAPKIFEILRAASFARSLSDALRDHRELLKPDIIWNVERGLELTCDELYWAIAERTRLCLQMEQYFLHHDLLITPAAIVPPFDAELPSLRELNGHEFPTYIDWVSIAYAITLTSCPALSLPCGYTKDGLPVGLQLVAPPRSEHKLLRFAIAIEKILALPQACPTLPKLP